VLGGGPITLPFTDVPASNRVLLCDRGSISFRTVEWHERDHIQSIRACAARPDGFHSSPARWISQSNVVAGGRRWVSFGNRPSGGLTIAVANNGGRQSDNGKSDGANLWVASPGSATVSRVRASDGAMLGEWTGAINAIGIVVGEGRVFVAGETDPGSLYENRPDPAAWSSRSPHH